MPITRTPMVDDDGSGTSGTVINNAWKSELYDQIDALAAPSAWKTIAGGFHIQNDLGTMQPATILVNRYRQLGGNTVAWEFAANPIQVAAVTANLYLVTLPFTLLGPTNTCYPVAFTYHPAYLKFMHAGALSTLRTDGTGFVAGTQWIYFSIVLEASGG